MVKSRLGVVIGRYVDEWMLYGTNRSLRKTYGLGYSERDRSPSSSSGFELWLTQLELFAALSFRTANVPPA